MFHTRFIRPSTPLALLFLAFATPTPAFELDDWSTVTAEAEGQTVYFNAWGGDSNVNAYIDWASDQLQARYDIELEHVKLADIGTAISRILAEKAAGENTAGAVDLMWLNGENFAAMKENDLLYGPWAEQLPNFELTAPEANPAVRHDFTVPVEGMEAPWGKAQLTFYYDSARVDAPPRSLDALLDWSHEHPGRFTYPRAPAFLGTTFLKQALLSLVDDAAPLYRSVSEADFDAVTAPLWAYLDKLHPQLWRQGRRFPDSGAELKRLMGDGELSLAFTFTPSGPAAAVANYQLPPTTRSYVLDGGTLGNVHFLAIPYNARHKAGALVVANFLLSPEAQARKQAIDSWGDATVLVMERLSEAQRQAFESKDDHPAALPAEARDQLLPEPHPSWTPRLERAWLERYGVQ